MKGYKYLSENMYAPFRNHFKYEMDKWYEVENKNKLEICEYGFHFFTTLKDIFTYVFYDGEDIYEVEADGKILQEDVYTKRYENKYCSSRIKIVKKLEKEDIWRLIEEENLITMDTESINLRIHIAGHGYGLDKLIYDKSWEVRYEVACQGYGLDILINDNDPDVRMAVAQECYGLDVLINDENERIRAEVAYQGYGLDKLINDKSWIVRRAVAEQKYGLDILINDESLYVRVEVAHHGYGLDILVNDEDLVVRKEAEKMLKLFKHKKSIE